MLSCLGSYKINPSCYPERVAHVVATGGFLSYYLSSPLPYVLCQLTVNKIGNEIKHKTVTTTLRNMKTPQWFKNYINVYYLNLTILF